MLELGKPIHTFDAAARPRRPDHRPPRAARASGSRRSTTSCASWTRRRCSSPTRPVRSASPASWAAPTSEVGDATTRRRRRVGDLRPGQHPPDGLPLRPAIRGQPALREGPGAPARADRRRPDGPPHRRVGRRRASRPGAVDTNPDRARAAPASRSGRRASTGCSARTLADRRAARRCWPGSGSRPSRPPPGTPDPSSPPAPQPLEVDPGDAETLDRDRPDAGGATSRSRPTSPRRSPGSAATSSSRRSCRTRRCPHYRPSPLEAARRASARRSPGPALTEVVTYALVAPRHGRAVRPATTAPPVAGRGRAPAAGPITVTNPLSSQHSVLRQSLDRQPARGRRRRTCARAATTSRSSRSARATGPRTTATDPRVVAPGLRADRAGRDRRPGTGRPGRTTSTTPRASSSSLARRLGLPRPAYDAADRRSEPASRSGRPGHGRRATLAGQRRGAPSGASLEALDLRAERVVVAELAVAGLVRRPAARSRAVATPSRHPVVERDLAVVVAERSTAGRGRGRRSAATAARCCATVDAVRHLPRPPAGRRREEPRLPARASRPTTGR